MTEIFRSEMNLINPKAQPKQKNKTVKKSSQELNKETQPGISNIKSVSYLDEPKTATENLNQSVENTIKTKKPDQNQTSACNIPEPSFNTATTHNTQEDSLEDRFTYLYEIANQLLVVDKNNIPVQQLSMIETILERGRLIASNSKNRRGIKQAGDNLYVKVNQGDFAGAVATKQTINNQDIFVIDRALDQKESHQKSGAERFRKTSLSPDARETLEKKLSQKKA